MPLGVRVNDASWTVGEGSGVFAAVWKVCEEVVSVSGLSGLAAGAAGVESGKAAVGIEVSLRCAEPDRRHSRSVVGPDALDAD